MDKPLDLTFYNPARLKDDDFLRGFVARRELAEKILARLGEIKLRGIAQHRLILGQRGMGKTSLLRRIALGVRDTTALSSVLLPLSFREEQYNVHNLHVFWRNCLDALGDWYEAIGQSDQAQSVDRETAALDDRADDDEGSLALGVFREKVKREGKRPLLLLDNLDLIFAGLKEKQWSLRRVLQESGGIVIIGASTGFLEATANPEAAFYDFFQVDVLEKLSHKETLSCLRRLADERGEAGRKVIRVLDQDPARIHALYDLTGGNPRTLAMLYLMLEMSDDGDLMRDLERLLDQATPLYKARVEEFPAQSRVVFDAVALVWNPVGAADVAAATGLEIGAVSSQLDRLHRIGVLEKTSLAASVRTGFQLAERFFNIWYLMRHAPRRQRSRLRWLTEFLRNFYSPRQLAEVATGFINRAGSDHLTRGTFLGALSGAIDDGEMRDTLCFEASQEMMSHAVESGVSLESISETADIKTPKNAEEWLKHGFILHIKMGAFIRAEAAYRKAIELDPQYALPWNNLGTLYKNDLDRYEDAEVAFHKAIELDSNFALAWNNLGNLLSFKQNRYEEAEVAFRKAIELNSKSALPWNNLGILLANYLGRYKEAEVAYRKAIDLNPMFTAPWNGLGNLLRDCLARYEEAEAAYRRAIEIDPKYSVPWNNLGRLLADYLDRSQEAEQLFRKALEIDPSNLFSIVSLAYFLLGRPYRREEAETFYQRANSELPAPGAGLLRAYHALTEDNFGAAVTEIKGVLDNGHADLFGVFYGDLLRVLRLTAVRGYGEKLLAWFGESGMGDRYWPLYAAFDAYLHGEDKLRDVNPEVGSAARRIFSSLSRGPRETRLNLKPVRGRVKQSKRKGHNK